VSTVNITDTQLSLTDQKVSKGIKKYLTLVKMVQSHSLVYNKQIKKCN